MVVVELWLWNEVAIPASGLGPSGPDQRSFRSRRSVSSRTTPDLTLAQGLESRTCSGGVGKWLFHFKIDYFTLKLLSSPSRLGEVHSEAAQRTRTRHNQSELHFCGSTRSRSQADRDHDIGAAGRIVDDDVARSTRGTGSAGSVGVRALDENLDPGGAEQHAAAGLHRPPDLGGAITVGSQTGRRSRQRSGPRAQTAGTKMKLRSFSGHAQGARPTGVAM